MTTWIALVRAVNLAGRNAVAMSDLRTLCESCGLADVRTLLQSGNVVFRTARREASPALEQRLEKDMAARLGLETHFMVRSAEEWDAIVAKNPFRAEATRDPGHLVAMILKAAPAPASVKALQAAIKGPERLRASGSHLYIVYPDGMGRSKLTNAVIEKTLAIRGTARNWNTVLKLQRVAQEISGLHGK